MKPPNIAILLVLIIGLTGIGFMIWLGATGQLSGRDWELDCRNRATKYQLEYVDSIHSSKCWVRQPSGDLINLWQE